MEIILYNNKALSAIGLWVVVMTITTGAHIMRYLRVKEIDGCNAFNCIPYATFR
jgi:hypothetical protein